MKPSLTVILCSLLAAASFAADISLSVTLAASPAGQVALGSPVTLTATATIQWKGHPARELAALQEHIRYTFSVQTIAIATNVPTRTVTWSPQSAGVYDISVRATYIEPFKPLSADLRRAPFATASLQNYKVFTTGADLVMAPSISSEACYQPDPCQCQYVTLPIYVKNIGNVTVSTPIVVLVKQKDQVIQTWTITAPAWGTQVKAGSYTTFPWNCPAIGDAPATYSVTVDATNAVQETNEQNNVSTFAVAHPSRTTFQRN